jgi:hypothetical protein
MARLPSSFSDTLYALAATDLQESGGHPTSEELLKFSSRKLSDQEASRIRLHLALCRKCAQTALDLMTFPDVELRAAMLKRTRKEEDDDWQAIQKRITFSAQTTSSALIGRLRPATFSRRPTRIIPHRGTAVLKALATAVTLIFLLGLSYWLGTLKRSRSLPRPSSLTANVHVQDLLPVGASGTRDSVPGGILSIPKGMDRLVLILANSDFRAFHSYRLEMIAGSGIRWEHEDLVRSPDGSFSIELPLASLPATDYRIDLFGIGTKGPELLATYQFKMGQGPF